MTRLRGRAQAVGMGAIAAAIAAPAYATCSISGAGAGDVVTATCDASAPNPWPGGSPPPNQTLGRGPANSSNAVIALGPGAAVVVGNSSAISVSDGATITLQAGALVQNSATNNNGLYGTGANTIDFRNDTTLLIQAGATVYSSGTEGQAEAVNPEGTGNLIDNFGTIRADHAAALWFQDKFTGSAPLNVVVNEASGLIQGPSASANVFGASGNGPLDFTNKGRIVGSLSFAGGNDALHLYTGSSVTGTIDGGGGNNLMTLNGTGTGSMAGALTRFQTLQKQDSGVWTLTGPVKNSNGPLAVDVQGGTLVLTDDNTAFNGSMTIDPGGALQLGAGGASGGLAHAIVDNGTLAFDRSDVSTFSSLISGTGAVRQIGTGTTALSAGNTFSGGVYFDNGTLAAGADSAFGAATGGLTFNGGAWRLTNSFDPSSTRAIVINGASGALAGGGTIDADGFLTTITQGISGDGALTVASTAPGGVVTLTGASAYAGGTAIDAGATLQLGNGGASGSIVGDVADNGALAFDRSDALVFAGAISGSGSVSQTGTGTTVLAADSTYTGGTTIAAGTLQLGNGGTSGSIVGDVTDNGTLAFDRSDTVAFAGIISGSGGVNQIGSGTTVLNAVEPYAGATQVLSGALAIGDAAHPAASLASGGLVTVAAGGTLAGYGGVEGSVVNAGRIAVANALPSFAAGPSGTFTIGGDLTNPGVAQIAGQGVGNALLVRGDYDTGAGAGQALLRTELNAGGSLANQFTDRLLILGSASGATTLSIDAFGAGAYTSTGSHSSTAGISVVQVGGASSVGAFALPGGYVSGGTPFKYNLYAYGPGSPNGPAAQSQNALGGGALGWDYRLESVYVSPQGPVDPPPGPLPPGERPSLTPPIPAYITLPTALFNAGLQDLDSLHRRLGEIRDDATAGQTKDGEVFLRSYGNAFDYTSNRSFVDYGFNSTQDYAAIQVGADGIVRRDAGGTLRAGLYGTYGQLWFSPRAVDGESNARFSTYTLAGALTWQASSGWYVDSILAGGIADGGVNTPTRGRAATLSSNSVAASIETGYPIALGWAGLVLEPQAQIIGQYLDVAPTVDVDHLPVALGSQTQGVLRAGVRLLEPLPTSGGVLTAYLKANLLQGLGGGGDVALNGYPFATGAYGTALQVGAGVNGALSRALTLHGDVAWQDNVSTAGFRGWTLNAGLRYAF